MTFADKVKHVRKKLYLSQEALAQQVGVSYATINRWENEHGLPNLVMEAKFDDFCIDKGITFEEK